MSDMQPSELVITMIVSDIASIPMQNTSQPLLSGVIPVAILVALEITASIIMMKWSGFRSLVCGKPVIVIKDGRILQSAMKKLRLTRRFERQIKATGDFFNRRCSILHC